MRLILNKLICFLLLLNFQVIPQINTIPKQGGICFRVDDNHPISEYLDYAAVFNKYNQNFSFALNLDITNIDAEYVDGIKQLQADGHEMMDHTPSHKTHFFYTILSTDFFINHPGVEQIDGNKVKLKHMHVDINNAKRNGYVNIEGDIIKSSEGIFGNFSKYDCYLFFPDLDTLVYINDYAGNWIDNNTVKITDVWNDSVNLGTHNNIQFYNFDNKNVHLTIDAVKAIAQETRRLADHFDIERPVTWIQPGGYFPRLYREELRHALENELNYKAAGVFANPGIKVFNEYNPSNDKQFGMNWGDFNVYSSTAETVKKIISNRIAKHNILIGASHFENLLNNDWDAYLIRVDSVLNWCVYNDIPIRTYSEWADILYSQTPDPLENIFPSLCVDKDNNDYPDGFFKKSKVSSNQWLSYEGQWIEDDGVPESDNHSFSISKVGNICFVGRYYYYQQDGLGGLEKGENEFEIWTKGAQGNFIEVDFKIGSSHSTYKFPAENSEWTKFNLNQSLNGNTSLFIPDNISTIDVTVKCSQYTSGKVKISGIKLAKSLIDNDYLNVIPDSILVSSDSGSVEITIESNSSWKISSDSSWIHLSASSGNRNRVILAEYSFNQDSLERRTYIVISNESTNKKIKFIQKGAHYFTIQASPDTSIAGIVEGSGKYLTGTEITLIAKPKEGWKFEYWVEDSTIVSADSIYTFIVNESRALIAKFKKISTDIKTTDIFDNQFKLYQNYPNPFNPTTTIKYTIPKTVAGRHVLLVQLRVYDALGKKVAALVNKQQKPGVYEVKFYPLQLPSGIYYYHIKVITRNHSYPFEESKKMIYLK